MITRRGVATIATGIGAIMVGIGLDVLPLSILGVLALAALALARFQVGLARFEVEHKVPSSRIFETTTLPISVTVRSTSPYPLDLIVHQPLPASVVVKEGRNVERAHVTKKHPADVRVVAEFAVRGTFHIEPPRIRVEDPFGLVAKDVQTASVPETVFVMPRIVRPREFRGKTLFAHGRPGRFIMRKPGDGSEFFGIRQYAPGDPLRSVNWKASAKVTGLLVNQREAEFATDVVCFVDARDVTGFGPLRTAPIHDAARAAANVMRLVMETGDSFKLVTYGDTVKLLTTDGTSGGKNRMQEHITALEPGGDVPLLAAINEVMPHIRMGGKVMIISPLAGDPSIVEAAATLMARGFSVTLMAPAFADQGDEVSKVLAASRKEGVNALRNLGAYIIDASTDINTAIMMERGML